MTRILKSKYPSLKELGAKTGEILRFVDPENDKWSAFNPCIAFSPEYGYAMTIRSSNYVFDERTGVLTVVSGGTLIKSDVWFAYLDQETFQIIARQKIKFDGSGPSISRGLEDARLFWRDGSWHFTAVMLEREHTPYSRMVVYKYDQFTNTASFVKKYDGSEVFRPEKNWMLPENPNPNFDFVTGPTTTYKDGVFSTKSSNLEALGGIRGGTNLLELGDGTYLGLTHFTHISRFSEFNKNTYSYVNAVVKYYTHQFVRYNNYGAPIEVSEDFVFDVLGIEFAAGLVRKGDQYVITYGNHDASARMATIDVDVVLGMLEPVDEVHISTATPKIN